MSNQGDISFDWVEGQPGYAHGLPPFIPGTKHKLLSRGGGRLWVKPRAEFNDADIYVLEHLYARYRSEPFKRGDLDAGRINRLLGREMVFATENDDPLSPETMLRIEVSPRDFSMETARAPRSIPADSVKPTNNTIAAVYSGQEQRGNATPTSTLSTHMDKDGSSSSRPTRRYRYGAKPTWEIVLDAVRAFGRPVSSAEIGNRIAEHIPDFAQANLGPDLSVLSVNCPSRGHHGMNRTPRKTNSGNPYDQLIRIGSGRGVRFAVYDPIVHGVWELAEFGGKVLRPRFLCTADSGELESARDSAVANGLFDSGLDARNRIMAAIVQREGQPAFRQALLKAYGFTCAISGCAIEALLEAAHIVPYQGSHTNIVTNGLLLRADLHKLFDLHLFCIDPDTRTVRLSDELRGSEYAGFAGARLRAPLEADMTPLTEALKHHHERCGWLNAKPDGAPLDEI